MVTIRLARHGTNKAPFYRIVVTDRRNPRDGRFLETIGTFDPRSEPVAFRIDQARFEHWKKVGARPSDTVERLVRQSARAAG